MPYTIYIHSPILTGPPCGSGALSLYHLQLETSALLFYSSLFLSFFLKTLQQIHSSTVYKNSIIKHVCFSYMTLTHSLSVTATFSNWHSFPGHEYTRGNIPWIGCHFISGCQQTYCTFVHSFTFRVNLS